MHIVVGARPIDGRGVLSIFWQFVVFWWSFMSTSTQTSCYVMVILGWGWGGVGWGNDVHVNLHTHVMLRYCYVLLHLHTHGMLRYGYLGVGLGGVGWGNDVHVNLHTHTRHATLWLYWGGVGWGGAMTFMSTCTHTSCYVIVMFSCTCTHTSCYVMVIFSCTCTHTRHATLWWSSLALAHTRHATLWWSSLALAHTGHATLWWSSLALAHTGHATLWWSSLALAHTSCYAMVIFSCTCTHTSCYVMVVLGWGWVGWGNNDTKEHPELEKFVLGYCWRKSLGPLTPHRFLEELCKAVKAMKRFWEEGKKCCIPKKHEFMSKNEVVLEIFKTLFFTSTWEKMTFRCSENDIFVDEKPLKPYGRLWVGNQVVIPSPKPRVWPESSKVSVESNLPTPYLTGSYVN